MLISLAVVNLFLSLMVIYFHFINYKKCKNSNIEKNKAPLFIVLMITSLILTAWYVVIIFRGSEFQPIIARLNTTLLLMNTIALAHAKSQSG